MGRGRRAVMWAPRFRGQAASAAFEAICPDDLFDHADSQTLLKAAKLTPVPTPLINRAIFIGQANIFGVFLNGALEKAFAAFAGAHTVVLAGRVVTADRAEQGGGLLGVIGAAGGFAGAVATAGCGPDGGRYGGWTHTCLRTLGTPEIKD